MRKSCSKASWVSDGIGARAQHERCREGARAIPRACMSGRLSPDRWKCVRGTGARHAEPPPSPRPPEERVALLEQRRLRALPASRERASLTRMPYPLADHLVEAAATLVDWRRWTRGKGSRARRARPSRSPRLVRPDAPSARLPLGVRAPNAGPSMAFERPPHRPGRKSLPSRWKRVPSRRQSLRSRRTTSHADRMSLSFEKQSLGCRRKAKRSDKLRRLLDRQSRFPMRTSLDSIRTSKNDGRLSLSSRRSSLLAKRMTRSVETKRLSLGIARRSSRSTRRSAR